jgi:hypothetical protein
VQAVTPGDLTCTRDDPDHASGEAPVADVIKIDVEGYEYQVLDGFGDLLKDVLGIEAEAWFYPAYKNQFFLQDLIEKLMPFGLRLRRIETVPGFEGDLVCVNAYFTPGRIGYDNLSLPRKAKSDLITKVWKLDRTG